ncbi:MAG: acetyl-CoA hydrolase/transferase C-terminal domain-containing protein [bacterium]
MGQANSVEDAVSCIRSGHRVFVHGGAATPAILVQALVDQAARLQDVEIIHLHTEGHEALYAQPQYAASFRVANLFIGSNVRPYFDGARVDYLPCFLSEIPALFRSGRRKLDVAMVQVSPPDRHGCCSLGVSVDVARAAVEAADTVIAQINPAMPRVHGDGFIHLDDIDYWIEAETPLPEIIAPPPGPAELAIAKNCAQLVEDGSTLQVGIGAIPNAVLGELIHHRHLGVHTEMWSDGMLPLLESGVVDNSRKASHQGRTVSGFVMGSRKLYDFIDDNPQVAQFDIGWVNRVDVIAQNPKVVAINSAVEIDLTGQVCADSVGHRIISGVGGQMDFIRGASLSEGGKPIIAITSTTGKGASRIVPTLHPGAGVVTTRAHVHYVVTEYGVADLYGKTLGERAEALMAIAHPSQREALQRGWREIRG